MSESPIILVAVDNLYFQTPIESAFEKAGFKVLILGMGKYNLPAGKKPVGAIVEIGNGSAWVDILVRLRESLPETKILCFGSHMDLDSFAQASNLGADTVLARSRFMKLLPGLPKTVGSW